MPASTASNAITSTETHTHALVFLAIREKPKPLNAILLTIDCIDRSEPRLDELNGSLGWLQAQRLVRKEVVLRAPEQSPSSPVPRAARVPRVLPRNTRKEEEEKIWLYTETGAALWESIYAKMKRRDVFAQWDAIDKHFSQLPEVAFQPDDVTEKDIASANRRNRKWFREFMRKCAEKEAKPKHASRPKKPRKTKSKPSNH